MSGNQRAKSERWDSNDICMDMAVDMEPRWRTKDIISMEFHGILDYRDVFSAHVVSIAFTIRLSLWSAFIDVGGLT